MALNKLVGKLIMALLELIGDLVRQRLKETASQKKE